MKFNLRPGKILFAFLLLSYGIFLAFFYWKYVPLIKSFQLFLIPVLSMATVVTALNAKRGIILFTFCFPLINSLPYFFGIDEPIPHAPTALVLFLFFLLGFLIHHLFKPVSRPGAGPHPIFKPLALFALIVAISGLVGLFRYLNFFPFVADGIYELTVNVNGVRAGGAIMSVILSSLNYLTGMLFFFLVFPYMKQRNFRIRMLATLSFAAFPVLLFGLAQKYISVGLGNMSFWRNLGQINATLKDPNSLGAFLSAVFPLFLGMAFSWAKKTWRFFLGLSLFLCLLILPAIGARSTLIAIAAGLLSFGLLSLITDQANAKRKVGLSMLCFFLVVLVVFAILALSPESTLSRRMKLNLGWLSGELPTDRFFSQRLIYWKAALKMIRSYPLTGVGVGSYIIELPNLLEKMDLPFEHTDSTLNYVLQVGSELGLFGVFVIFWILAVVLAKIRRLGMKLLPRAPDRYVNIGAISGLVAMGAIFLFQTFIGSFEIKYLFWLLAAFILGSIEDEDRPESQVWRARKPAVPWALFAGLAAIAFGTVHFGNSMSSLSIRTRNEMFLEEQDFGFYQWESDRTGNAFRWTQKKAGLAVPNLGPRLVIPIKASHPDMEKNPVRLQIFEADSEFRKRKLIREMAVQKREWENLILDIRDRSLKKIYLIFEISHTWQPFKSTGAPDLRSLGIAVRKEWFIYEDEIKSRTVQSADVIPLRNWAGQTGNRLGKNGSSEIYFWTKDDNAAVRLWALGQKAFNCGPYLVIYLDGECIGKTVLQEKNWQSLVLPQKIERGQHILSVKFINDVYDPNRGFDRNAILGDLEILYLTPENEPAALTLPGGRAFNIIIFMLDAARPDHFSCYGYDRKTTPHVDSLAEKSTIFDSAISEVSFSFGAVAALSTGLYPPQTGLLEPRKLDPSVMTLADFAREQGYRTMAYSESPFFSKEFGLDRPFDRFVERFPFDLFLKNPRQQAPSFRSEPGIYDALEWMAEESRPFFSFFYVLRPHNPYDAPEPFSGWFGGKSDTRLLGTTPTLTDIDDGAKKITDSDLKAIINLYDENLLYGDFLFGFLLKGLRDRQLLDKTIIVILSDHGEAFLEHGRILHTTTVYDEMIRIPLVIYWPGLTKGSRCGMQVQMVDVACTLGKAMGRKYPPGALAGISLLPFLKGLPEEKSRFAFSWSGEKSNRIAIRSPQYKMIFSEQNGLLFSPAELYDLQKDPQEKRPLSVERNMAAQHLFTAYKLAFPNNKLLQDPQRYAPEKISPEALKKIRSLGYIR